MSKPSVHECLQSIIEEIEKGNYESAKGNLRVLNNAILKTRNDRAVRIACNQKIDGFEFCAICGQELEKADEEEKKQGFESREYYPACREKCWNIYLADVKQQRLNNVVINPERIISTYFYDSKTGEYSRTNDRMITFWINNTGVCATISRQSKSGFEEIQRVPAEQLYFDLQPLVKIRFDHAKMMLKQLTTIGPWKVVIEREDQQEHIKIIRIVEKR